MLAHITAFSIFLLLSMRLFSINVTNVTEDIRKDEMMRDLDFIKKTFEINYAPYEWKKAYYGWDLDLAIENAKEQIKNSPSFTMKDFKFLLNKFFHSVKDYHVSVYFYSTESATLPFRVKAVNGKYFFSFIYQDQIDLIEAFPFTVGDELISINAISLDELVQQLKENEIGTNHEKTDQELAELYLTTRLGSLGHEIPRGKVSLCARKHNSEEIIKYVMEWDYETEKIKEPIAPRKSLLTKSLKKTSHGKNFRRNLMESPFFTKEFMWQQSSAIAAVHPNNSKDMFGSKSSMIPKLGRVIWQNEDDSIFDAYLFEMPDKNVGAYIRIPDYNPILVDEAAQEFCEIIERFQKKSDGLVIDQINNPGGLILYMYSLAAMLTDKDLSVPRHRFKITQEDVFYALSERSTFENINSDEDAQELFGDTILGLCVDKKLIDSLKSYAQFIIDEWESDRQFTVPDYIYGIGPIHPHQTVRYTKPILLVVNSLDFSGGDFFPAIFQDNGRAKILGTRTAGAGGCVNAVSYPNLNGISGFRYTTSLAERDNHQLIENYGVTPEILYEISEVDLQDGYIEYAEKIVQELQLSIKESKGKSWKYPFSKK